MVPVGEYLYPHYPKRQNAAGFRTLIDVMKSEQSPGCQACAASISICHHQDARYAAVPDAFSISQAVGLLKPLARA
jgi:hypothetical protein